MIENPLVSFGLLKQPVVRLLDPTRDQDLPDDQRRMALQIVYKALMGLQKLSTASALVGSGGSSSVATNSLATQRELSEAVVAVEKLLLPALEELVTCGYPFRRPLHLQNGPGAKTNERVSQVRPMTECLK